MGDERLKELIEQERKGILRNLKPTISDYIFKSLIVGFILIGAINALIFLFGIEFNNAS